MQPIINRRDLDTESKIAAIHSAMASLDHARHKLTDKLFDRVPHDELEKNQQSTGSDIKDAVSKLQTAFQLK